jgi:hypothetical protein
MSAVRIALVSAILFAAASAGAQPEPALRCEATARGVHATFELTNKGAAQVTVALSGGVVTCPLLVRSLHDRPKAKQPEAGVDLTLDTAACKPALPNAEQFLTGITIRLALRGERNLPKGRVQWMKDEQPGECAVSAWDHAAVEVLAEKRQKRSATAEK